MRDRPEWWQFITRATLEYGDIANSGYADSLIQGNDRATNTPKGAGRQFKFEPASCELKRLRKDHSIAHDSLN